MGFIFISIVVTLKLFVDNSWIVHKVDSSAEITQNRGRTPRDSRKLRKVGRRNGKSVNVALYQSELFTYAVVSCFDDVRPIAAREGKQSRLLGSVCNHREMIIAESLRVV